VKRPNLSKPLLPLLCFVILIVPILKIGATSTWIESGLDFEDGLFNTTELADDSIRLAQDPSRLTNWTAVQGGGPIDLEWQNMVYDPVNHLSILYGSGMYANSTWTYDSNLNKWSEMKPATNPWRRIGHAMAFDTRHGVALLSGGGLCPSENWLYNLSTNTWALKANFTGNGREDHSVVYDDRDGIFFLFGGRAVDGYYGDSLTLNVSEDSWKLRREFNNPPARARHAMAYDKSKHLIVMFGGYCYSSSEQCDQFHDTWIFNLSDDHWTNVTPAISPQYLDGYRMVYDETIQNCVLFGGNETWVFNTTTNLWTNRTTVSGPAFRTGHSFVYDSDNRICVLYGGSNGPARFGDTWTYNVAKNEWTQKDFRIRPGAYSGSKFVYDRQNDKVLLFGGWFRNEQFDNTTWIFSPATNAWQRMDPSPCPPARAYHSMLFDEGAGVTILFGGRDTYKTFLNDTWTYDYETDAWVDKKTNVSPPADRDWQITYDSKNGLVFLFGVASQNGTDNCEIWTYNVSLNVWKRMEPKNSPPTSGPMAYDNKRDLICLFDRDNGFWTYDPASDDWTLTHFGSDPADIPMNYMHYDRRNDSMILAGGGNDHYETWSYDPSSNKYSELNHEVNPPTSVGEGLAFDSDAGIIFLYGGNDPRGTLRFPSDNFWIFGQPGFFPNGTYDSDIFDMNGSAFFDTLDWIGNETISSRIRFQLRSANSPDELNSTEFTGRDGTTRSFYTCSGQKINGVHNDSRFIHYRAYLETSNPVETPILRSVAIDYNLIHLLQVISPAGGENWSRMAQITWSVHDTDDDPISIDIYLENDSSSTLLFRNLPGDSTNRSWNTSDTPTGAYRICIVARDDNPTIPLEVGYVTGDFTIFHPPSKPPNRPPEVALLSPANNSVIDKTSVRLTWNGTDPDGDFLSYLVYLSDQPFTDLAEPLVLTSDEFLDRSGLEDGATYYWTVEVFDPFNLTAENPAGIRLFTINLPKPPPPMNHPPRITSTPLLTLKVNETWIYRILATDDDGDPLSISSSATPEGMIFDTANRILTWTPHTRQEGNHSITISVSDGKGGLDSQTFTLAVSGIPPPPEMPPVCMIDRPANGSVVKGALEVAGGALNGSLPLRAVHFRIDGGAWQTARGLANWTFSVDTRKLSNGVHTLEARSYDGVRYSNTTAIKVNVQNPAEKVTTGNNYCQPALILATILGLVFVLSLAFRKKK